MGSRRFSSKLRSAAYAELVIGDIYSNNINWFTPSDEIFHFTALVKLVTGDHADLAVYGYLADGSVLRRAVSVPLTDRMSYHKQLDIWFDPYNHLVFGTDAFNIRRVAFAIRVARGFGEDGKAFFDNIIVRRVVRTVPAGTIIAFGGQVTMHDVPRGVLPCDGGTYNIADYPSLAFALGYTVSGLTVFHVPDLRGRTLLGAGQGPGLSYYYTGATGGEEKHTLSTAELPSHTHSVGNHTHTIPGHTHTMGVNGLDSTTNTNGTARYPNFVTGAGTGSKKVTDSAGPTATDSAGAGATGSQGNGVPFNNMQPYRAVEYYIAF